MIAAITPHALLQAAVAFVLIALVGRGRWGLALLGAAVAALDQFALGLGSQLHTGPDGSPNWIGKCSELGAALILMGVLLRTGWTRSEFGLSMPRKGSLRAAIILIAILVAARAGLAASASDREPWSLAWLAFEATLPGLAEECMLRGVFLAIALRAVRRGELDEPGGIGRDGWQAIIAAAMLFASVHGLSPRPSASGNESGTPFGWGWEVAFAPMLFGRTFLTGMAYGWLRLRTGSLLTPIVAHNAANVAGTALAMR